MFPPRTILFKDSFRSVKSTMLMDCNDQTSVIDFFVYPGLNVVGSGPTRTL